MSSTKDFVRGYACAVAMIKASHDPGTPVTDALKACGLTSISKLRAKGVDEYDIEILRSSIKEIQSSDRYIKKFKRKAAR